MLLFLYKVVFPATENDKLQASIVLHLAVAVARKKWRQNRNYGHAHFGIQSLRQKNWPRFLKSRLNYPLIKS